MPRRPELTDSGLLAESYGRRPYTVTLREEREPGTNVLLDYTAGEKRRKRTLGYPVREKVGRSWSWDEDALERAREAARDRSAELRLSRLRDEVLEADHLTVGEAVEMYLDPRTGGLPKAEKTRQEYRRALRRWRAHLGDHTPWNRVRPSDVMARARDLEAQEKIPTLLNETATLRILYRWLDRKAGIEGLRNPVKGFPWKRFRDAHEASRPRYSRGELREIVRVRHQVDPRFGLLLSLMDDSGARAKAVRTLHRSAVDCPLDMPPTDEAAPYGWIVFPALKGQRAPLHLLTSFERRELELAFDGYLRELEARWQEDGVDYPLFPGARIADKGEPVVGVDQPGADRSVDAKHARRWLHRAERRAGVEHVDGRAYHGIRRAVSDLMYEEIGLDAMTAAMGWSSRDTPEKIYIDQRRMRDRIRAREVMEEKRRGGEEDDG